MTKLQRIVIGVDFSQQSIAALEWCARQFAPRAELLLVHGVVIPHTPGFLRGQFPQLATLEESAVRGARVRLEELVSTLPPAVPARTVTVRAAAGHPTEQLITAARDTSADLIVVARHGEGTGRWDHLGSTADALLRASPVPVLIAAGLRDHRPTRILAALDDDEMASLVLRWVKQLACAPDARVTALHVLSNAVLSHVLSVEAVATGKSRFTADEIRMRFREEAERWTERLMATGIDRGDASSEVAFGDPGTTILAAAKRLDAEMIVVGRRAASRLHRLMLGSVATEVLRRARCPVFVAVPTEDAVGEDAVGTART